MASKDGDAVHPVSIIAIFLVVLVKLDITKRASYSVGYFQLPVIQIDLGNYHANPVSLKRCNYANRFVNCDNEQCQKLIWGIVAV